MAREVIIYDLNCLLFLGTTEDIVGGRVGALLRSTGRSESPPLQQACICSPGAALKGEAICLQEMSTPHGVIRHFFCFYFLRSVIPMEMQFQGWSVS